MDAKADPELDRCKTEARTAQEFREAIPQIVEQLVASCQLGDCFDHVGPEPIPSSAASPPGPRFMPRSR